MKRCMAITDSGLPQAPHLYCTLPDDHEDAHEATNIRTGEVLKAWSKTHG